MFLGIESQASAGTGWWSGWRGAKREGGGGRFVLVCVAKDLTDVVQTRFQKITKSLTSLQCLPILSPLISRRRPPTSRTHQNNLPPHLPNRRPRINLQTHRFFSNMCRNLFSNKEPNSVQRDGVDVPVVFTERKAKKSADGFGDGEGLPAGFLEDGEGGDRFPGAGDAVGTFY